MSSIYNIPIRRPADVPDVDWMLLADAVFQNEPSPDESGIRPHSEIAADTLQHLAMVTALAERLLSTRWEVALLALKHGATPETVGAARRGAGLGRGVRAPCALPHQDQWVQLG